MEVDAPGIDTLPDELLLDILKLLPVETLVLCAEVSQRWTILARDPSIWRDVEIVYNPHDESEYHANLQLLKSHSDVTQCVEMRNIICYENIQHILQHCKNLKSIRLYSCEFTNFSDENLAWLWPQIKKLTIIDSAKQPTLLQFDKFEALCYLRLNNIYCDPDLRSLINCANLSHILIGQIRNLKIYDVKDLILSKKHVLKCFHIYGGKSIDDKCLNFLSECHNLTELIIFRCDHLTDEGLQPLALLKSLRVLELCYNEQFTIKALESFLTNPNLKQLICLKLFLIENVTPEMLVLISRQYKCLEYLNVLRCPRLNLEFRTGWGKYEEHIENLSKKIKCFYI